MSLLYICYTPNFSTADEGRSGKQREMKQLHIIFLVGISRSFPSWATRLILSTAGQQWISLGLDNPTLLWSFMASQKIK